MKKIFTAMLLIMMLAVSFSSCIPSKGSWTDCPSHDKNYFRVKR